LVALTLWDCDQQDCGMEEPALLSSTCLEH